MLAHRFKTTNVRFPFSVSTFVEHLPTSIVNSFPSVRFRTRTPTTVKARYSSHYETLTPRQKGQINLYVDALLQWNQKMNLTAVTEAEEVMERHIEDSLAMIPPIRDSYTSHCNSSIENLNVVDVGTGPGLPGLVLAIAHPGWKVTLVESMYKRCVFLEHAVNVTGLPNVRVVRGRAEDLGQNLSFRETFDIAVARAVAEMRILVEYCLPLVRVGGLLIAAKGHNPQVEVKNAERSIQSMGASVLQLSVEVLLKRLKYNAVESHSPHGQRTVVICAKDRPTPRKYPRCPGTPTKLPL